MSGLLLARRSAIGGKAPIVLPAIGDAWLGGYYAGIIDTTKGNIIAADDYQSGLRYALIVAGKSLEVVNKKWNTTADAGTAGTYTRWDGRSATAAMVALGSNYEAAYYCDGLAYPSDGASKWYLPAMDELELLYRNFKPTTATNQVGSSTKTFPGTAQSYGVNPSSDPTHSAFTSSAPAQTSVAVFESGGAQAMGGTGASVEYWSSTDSGGFAWTLIFSDTTYTGLQDVDTKTYAGRYVRPVRRLVL